ncbi:MAG: antitoxin [Candidatus Altiarchaeales archaeon IMC4]|nr:MAG: antitoxin [Candidatus Altiarchaeales archaeon IMC4]
MVQAVINIQENSNRILNIVKAKYGLRNKSDAIDLVINEYGDNFLEPELRPEYIEKAKEIMKQKPIHIGTVDDLRTHLGID